MKFKISLFVIFILTINSSYGQQNIDTAIRTNYATEKKRFQVDNFYLLGKIWGFLKYYHPNIAGGKYNWDKELIDFLPHYNIVNSLKERNDSLEAWINKFGETPICESCSDSILLKAKLKPDFAWINSEKFSESLISKLRYIQNNRIQKGQYYAKFMSQDGVNFVQFQHEDAYNKLKFPNDSYGLLSVFRFWNIIEYWYPYKYNLPTDWNTILKQFIEKILTHKNGQDYAATVEELITSIHDSHGYFRSVLTEEIAGKYYMPFTVKLVENQLLITSILNDSLANLSKITVGDIIESIEGIPVSALISHYTPYTPASNRGSLIQKMSYSLTRRNNTQTNLLIKRNGKLFNTTTINHIPKFYPPVDLDPPYFTFAKDSAFCMAAKNIGYINVGKFNRKDSLTLKIFLKKAKSLIIDNRQNQDEQKGTGGGDIIANLISADDNKFVKFSTLEPLYPGVFTLTEASNLGTISAGDSAYKEKIIILINEETISVGEFLTMAFQKAINVKTLGTTTAGADGNVTYITLPGGIFVQFTGLGVYYPDGKETQRIGITPDIIVKQTVRGYQTNKDEQLLKAINYLQKKK
jgi:C-terminal processing protease CtpA/Prc